MKRWGVLVLGVLALFVAVYFVWLVVPGISFKLSIIGIAPIAYVFAARNVRRPFIGFVARYGIVFVALVFLEDAVLHFFPTLDTALRGVTASAVGGMLGLGGAECSVSGSFIGLPNPPLTFDVAGGCLAFALLWLYVALVFATPGATQKQRLTGLCIGVAILLGFNIVRLSSSICLEWLAGVHIHDYFYFFNAVFVLLVWAGWLTVVQRKVSHGQGECRSQ